MSPPPPLRALEFYSGVGGLHYALKSSDPSAEVVAAFDWDPTSCHVYSANHGDIVQRRDISTLTAAELADRDANLWLMSPACQPYTVLNPNAKGAADPRAQSFFHLIQKVLPDLAQAGRHPDYLLVENVAGFEVRRHDDELVTPSSSSVFWALKLETQASVTRQVLLDALQEIGYETMELLLSPLQFGIPNSRLRYYLLARQASSLNPVNAFPGGEQKKVWREIPGMDQAGDVQVKPLSKYLDKEVAEGRYVPDKILGKWGRLFDIVKPSERRSCCFTRGYTHLVERSGSILQEAEELDTTSVFDEFLKAQAEGRKEDALDILRPLRLRYFTPSELLRIFAFDEETFVWPSSVSLKTKYRLIGNSVNVRVVQALLSYLLRPVPVEQ